MVLLGDIMFCVGGVGQCLVESWFGSMQLGSAVVRRSYLMFGDGIARVSNG